MNKEYHEIDRLMNRFIGRLEAAKENLKIEMARGSSDMLYYEGRVSCWESAVQECKQLLGVLKN